MKDSMKAYASYFVSYLLDNFNSLDINKILLFGSVARGNAEKESDIDIFIDLKKTTKTKEKDIRKILEDFYKSREALLFKSKGIDNKINLIIGKIDEWKNLKDSIESTGIILYGNYTSSDIEGKKYAIIFWDKIKKNRGAFLNKIYGFKIKDKRYEGLLKKFNGRKLGKSSVMVPVEYREDILREVRKYEVNARIIEVYM